MVETGYADAALILLGHGSSQNAQSSQTVCRQAAELRRRGVFAEVREAFLRQAPRLAEVLPDVGAERVFLVPLFISEGYFTEQAIPRELGWPGAGQGACERVQRRGHQTIYYCGPIGTHPSMTEVLLARARAVVRDHPFPGAPPPEDITLFIAGHGTTKDPGSRQAVERQVERIGARHPYAAVRAVFIEEPPRVAECYRLATTRNLVVVPFFTSDGLHVLEDIPRLLGQPAETIREQLARGQFPWRNPTERQGKRVWYAPSIGSAPQLPEVILQRVREAADGTPDTDRE